VAAVTIHATARTEYVRARLMGVIAALSLTGAPTIYDASVPRRSGDTGPWVRVTFDELDPLQGGRFSATQSTFRMAYLVVVDVFWPHTDQQATPDLYAVDRAANEIREALSFLKLSYLDYSTPSAPVAVSGATITISRPPTVRRVDGDEGWERRRVQAQVEWFARYDDFNA
jgi:hypothetical protein